MKKIIILGAGPCGLSASFMFSQNKKNVALYEAKNLVGGLGGSESIDGMTFDYGPHIYHTVDKDLERFWKKNFSDLLIEKEFFSKNYKDGILYDYPLSHDSIEKFPPKIRKKVKEELNQRKPENIMRAQNFKEVVQALVGPTIQSIFFEGYSKKLWGIPTTKMSSKWAPKRIEIRDSHSSFWHNQFSAAGKYGSGAIMNRMAEGVKSFGNKINLNHEVNKFTTSDNKITKIHFKNGEIVDSKDSIIISTLPLSKTSEMLGYKTKLQYNSYILAYVVVNQSEILPKNAQSIYFAHDENYFHRATEQKKYSDIGYPKNKTLICFEISYRTKPELIKKDPEQLCREVFKQFCALGFSKYERFEKGFTRVFPTINPIMYLGYEEELAKANSTVNQYENLYSVGGAAEYSYGDMQVMFLKARDTVDLFSSEHSLINKNIKIARPFKFNEIVQIENKFVGGNNPPLLIAEIGINHQGSKKIMLEMLKKSKASGFDVAKLQTYFADRVSDLAKSAKYVEKNVEAEESINEMFKRLQLNVKDHEMVFEWSKKNNYPVFSTPFDEQSVDLLLKFNVEAFKVASFDAVNLPLLKYIASKKKPIILSTGMCGMGEIEDALEAVASQDNKNLILLHCVSSYPADPRDINLNVISNLQKTFRLPVGYSDHTVGNIVSTAAMALGAHVIEKHFTLNKLLEGSDHALSADYKDLKTLSKNRDIIFSALGDGIKKPSFSENLQINSQRKSIFTRKNIKKGEKLSLENITIKGPGHGLYPKYLNLVLGKKVVKDIKNDTPVTWDELLKS
jgi:sialic acid synthase SpsE/protoporphyrinogen oxidase